MARTFTFFFVDGGDAAPPFQIETMDDEAQARRRAVQLLGERVRYQSVEVFEDQAAVFTITR